MSTSLQSIAQTIITQVVHPAPEVRLATAAVFCTVAAFAAVVSYSHIHGLGRAHGQDGPAAGLLPLSADGLILAASLMLLHEARNDRDAPRLAVVRILYLD